MTPIAEDIRLGIYSTDAHVSDYRLSQYDTSVWNTYSMNIRDVVDELNRKIDERAIATFCCIYCGTEHFKHTSTEHTPHCPNCGALMQKES